MSRLKRIIIIITLVVVSFLIGNKNIMARVDEDAGINGACYCCGGSQGCTYDWKAETETVVDNCIKVPEKTLLSCNGSSTSAGSGACWLCEPVSQDKYYKWTTDGSNPNTAYCYLVNGRSQSACSGVPSTDSGSTSSGDQEYNDYEDADGPDINSPSTATGCAGIMGSGDFHKYLTDILNAMRIVGVAMVIIFSTIDFAKALITQDNDAMKKASEKTMKRLILAMVIFFAPILLNILLGLIGLAGICI